jgi:flavin reductase (DIM6/NTAB) family NADH-FMN oxidoreductase RutF
VKPPRIAECPVQMVGIVYDVRPFGKNVSANAFEVYIVKLHVEESLLTGDASRPHIDPEVATADHGPCRFLGSEGRRTLPVLRNRTP